MIDTEGLAELHAAMTAQKKEAQRRKDNDSFSDEELSRTLYNAKPDCKHHLDPNCWSGIRCMKCPGWFCY